MLLVVVGLVFMVSVGVDVGELVRMVVWMVMRLVMRVVVRLVMRMTVRVAVRVADGMVESMLMWIEGRGYGMTLWVARWMLKGIAKQMTLGMVVEMMRVRRIIDTRGICMAWATGSQERVVGHGRAYRP